jgi:Ca-activated chloride channel family protein
LISTEITLSHHLTFSPYYFSFINPVSNSTRPFYRYGLFQRPLIVCILFLIAALLCSLLQWGQPSKVSVVMALDLSSSTYNSGTGQLGAAGTVSGEAIQAAKSYINLSSQTLRNPNKIKVLGFGGAVVDLTRDFSADAAALTGAIDAAVQPNAPTNVAQQVIPSSTDVNIAVQKGLTDLSTVKQGCKELLVFTDGQAELNPALTAQAIASGVKLNFLILGDPVQNLQDNALKTGGSYLAANVASDLTSAFTQRFFPRVNSNLNWVIICLGGAWLALMWTLVLPLDRFLQKMMGLRFDMAGRIAIGHGLFWSSATPIIVWNLLRILQLPLFSQC